MNTTTATATTDERRAAAALDEALSAIMEAQEAVAVAYRALRSLPDAENVSNRRDCTPLLDVVNLLTKAQMALPDFAHLTA